MQHNGPYRTLAGGRLGRYNRAPMNKAHVIQDLRRSLDLVLPCFDWDPALLARRYAPGKWTAREVLGHLTDAEIAFQARLRQILSEPGSPVAPFDPDRWAPLDRSLHRPVVSPGRDLHNLSLTDVWPVVEEMLRRSRPVEPPVFISPAENHCLSRTEDTHEE